MRLTFTELLLVILALPVILAYMVLIIAAYWLGWALDTLAYGRRTW